MKLSRIIRAHDVTLEMVRFLTVPTVYFFLAEVRATLRFSRVASCSATASSSGVDLDQSEASIATS